MTRLSPFLHVENIKGLRNAHSFVLTEPCTSHLVDIGLWSGHVKFFVFLKFLLKFVYSLTLCSFSLQVELLSHFGAEHFCPLSLIRYDLKLMNLNSSVNKCISFSLCLNHVRTRIPLSLAQQSTFSLLFFLTVRV